MSFDRVLALCPPLLLAILLPRAAVAEPPAPPQGLRLLEAVAMTFQHDPNLGQARARLDASRGALLAASGAFDAVLGTGLAQTESRDPLTESTSRAQRTLENSLSLTRPFRTGLSIAPAFDLTRTTEIGGGPLAANLGTVSVTVRQPLLRGRGRAAADAGELSAERELAASGLDLRQTTAERILAVATQYWVYAAAAADLEVLAESEGASRELLATTRKLIEADVVPAAEQVQLEANLAAKEAARIGGERDLFAARQDLGREIGLDFGAIAALPLPADPFPAVAPAEVPPPAAAARFVAAALARRADLAAARARRDEAEILLRAAGNALQPKLDLLWRPSYSGLVAGTDPGSFYSPLFRNVPGISSSLSLNLSWPTANRQARGLLVEAQAAREESALALDAFAKGIAADVPTALDAVRQSALQLAKAEQAVTLFERAVVNQEKKLRGGTSTLLDVISQRDRLTAARQSRVAAQLSLALAIVRLRFATGTLLAPGADPGALAHAQLTALPSATEVSEAVP
jgi:outer membrane protein